MPMIRSLTVAVLAVAASPLAAQNTPTTPATQDASAAIAPPQTAASELTPEEQKTLNRCAKLGPGQAAQSSKCSAVMVKAGQGDPAKTRSPVANGASN